MKQIVLLAISLAIINSNCFSQNSQTYIDSIESSFTREDLVTSVPCHLNLDRKVDESGKIYFINSKNTRVDVAFFKISSLPFYNDFQTNFGTASSYINWIKFLNSPFADKFSIIEENIDSGFVLIKISDPESEILRIISRHNGTLFIVTMKSNEFSKEKQIEYLKYLLKINKRFQTG